MARFIQTRRVIPCALAVLSWSGVPAACAGTPTPFAPPPADAPVIYRHATLIDGTGAPPRADTDVLVAGQRIRQIFPDSARAAAPIEGIREVDLRGRFLIPGLIDSHVHLATPPNRRQAEAEMRRNVYGGVTAVRDMADDLRAVGDLARSSRVGEIAGPDIFYASLMAGPDFFKDPRTIETSAGGVPGEVPWMQAITDHTDLPLAVARAKGTYATAVKLYAALDAALASRIAAEAHRQHMLVWAHATLYPARPSEVVAAGADTISHACLLVREAMADVPPYGAPPSRVDLAQFRSSDSPVLARLFAAMVQRGVILDATIWAYAIAPAPAAAASAPGSTPALTPGGCDDLIGGAITTQAYRAGVQVAAGTDAVAPAAEPWPELFHELSALAGLAHMPPQAVLRSATVAGARAAGQERDMGTLEAGKLANMVILEKNPLASVDNLKSVVMTIKRGRVFQRSDFMPLEEGDITDLY